MVDTHDMAMRSEKIREALTSKTAPETDVIRKKMNSDSPTKRSTLLVACCHICGACGLTRDIRKISKSIDGLARSQRHQRKVVMKRGESLAQLKLVSARTRTECRS